MVTGVGQEVRRGILVQPAHYAQFIHVYNQILPVAKHKLRGPHWPNISPAHRALSKTPTDQSIPTFL